MPGESAHAPPELRGIRKRLFDRFSDSVATGLRTHPFLTTKGHALLEEARVLAPRLSDRGTYAAGILRSVLATEGTYASAVLLTNHALQLLVPDYALRVEEAIQEAKFRVGAASSNVEDPMEEILRSPGSLLIFGGETVRLGLAFGEASRGFGEDAYGKIRDLGLDDFDAPEDSIAGLPRIERSTGGELVFRCPACAAIRNRSFEEAGATFPCRCGAAVRVPIPSLGRALAHLKAKRDAECGIGRCRVCRRVLQKGRGGFMTAGFCSASCAKEGVERFGEHVARSSMADGDRILFLCRCGAALRAASGQVGTRMPCGSCGLDVWVPRPEQARRRGGVARCGHCGRNVKARAPRCLYCGNAPNS
jgi:hypothetical protein